MNDVFSSYLRAFFHPFETQRELRGVRGQHEASNQPRAGMGLAEVVSVSWLMAAANAAYAILGVYLSLRVFEHYGSGRLSQNLIVNQEWVLFSILFKVALFPASLWVYMRIWCNMIKMVGHVFGVQEDWDRVCPQIVNQAATTNTFLLIPVFGKGLSVAASAIHIYAGLRCNLGFSRWQALATIVLPIFLLLALVAIFLVSVIFFLVSLFGSIA